MTRCGRESEGDCQGRIEYHHALIERNKRLQEAFAIVSACTYHHRGAGKNDAKWRLIAYKNASAEDFEKHPKSRARWEQEMRYLTTKYAEGKQTIITKK